MLAGQAHHKTGETMLKARRTPILAILAGIVFTLTAAQTVGTAEAGEQTIRQYGRITKVVDGDTVDVRLRSGKEKRIRLIGIDTPEVYPEVECGGLRASRSAKRLLPVGTRVKLVSDPTQARVDSYDRLLRYVIKRSTGRDINRAQVWLGMATVYVYDNTPFQRTQSYRDAQRSARNHDRGIWKNCR